MDSVVTCHNPYAGYVMTEPEIPVFPIVTMNEDTRFPQDRVPIPPATPGFERALLPHVTPVFEPSPINTATLPELLAVMDERKRQQTKFGSQDYADSKWITVLAEEVGEAAQAVLRLDDAIQTTDKREIAGALDHLHMELIQIAAVAVAHAEKITARLKRAGGAS